MESFCDYAESVHSERLKNPDADGELRIDTKYDISLYEIGTENSLYRYVCVGLTVFFIVVIVILLLYILKKKFGKKENCACD